MPTARASSAPLPTEVSLARIISQGLVPATSASDVVAAVARQLAIQGQGGPADGEFGWCRDPAAAAGPELLAVPARSHTVEFFADQKALHRLACLVAARLHEGAWGGLRAQGPGLRGHGAQRGECQQGLASGRMA